MKDKGLRPNDVTYNSLIDACVRCSQMGEAWRLLEDMSQSEDVRPDNFTYSTLIKGIRADTQAGTVGNYGDLERAFRLLE